MKKLSSYVVGLGLLTGCAGDPVSSPDEPESPASLAVTIATPAFTQVSAGFWHTCGLTSRGQLYCWGDNRFGQLGDGATEDRALPTLVAGRLRFRQVSAGSYHTCASTKGNRAYCWGSNSSGQLGDGTTIEKRVTPVPVTGGRGFRQVSALGDRTCALTTSKKIYCWGRGILGNGSDPSLRRTPQLVSGTYRQVAVGLDHTCAVSTTYKVWCWGYNRFGQLGNGSGSTSIAITPVAVAGTLQFLQVSTGAFHTCAVTTTDKAYCWGYGRTGEIGDGQADLRFTPRAVLGGLSFARVTAGSAHTCGETTGNRAYCWGWNGDGQLGDGTFNVSLTPKAVSGGLAFAQVDAGAWHTCGVAGSVIWCWGMNHDGQLGNGTFNSPYLNPTRVR
jgi:alpha-tubulin suppressor-like RCC1 family protein